MRANLVVTTLFASVKGEMSAAVKSRTPRKTGFVFLITDFFLPGLTVVRDQLFRIIVTNPNLSIRILSGSAIPAPILCVDLATQDGMDEIGRSS
jgi:hypothetical protein